MKYFSSIDEPDDTPTDSDMLSTEPSVFSQTTSRAPSQFSHGRVLRPTTSSSKLPRFVAEQAKTDQYSPNTSVAVTPIPLSSLCSTPAPGPVVSLRPRPLLPPPPSAVQAIESAVLSAEGSLGFSEISPSEFQRSGSAVLFPSLRPTSAAERRWLADTVTFHAPTSNARALAAYCAELARQLRACNDTDRSRALDAISAQLKTLAAAPPPVTPITQICPEAYIDPTTPAELRSPRLPPPPPPPPARPAWHDERESLLATVARLQSEVDTSNEQYLELQRHNGQLARDLRTSRAEYVALKAATPPITMEELSQLRRSAAVRREQMVEHGVDTIDNVAARAYEARQRRRRRLLASPAIRQLLVSAGLAAPDDEEVALPAALATEMATVPASDADLSLDDSDLDDFERRIGGHDDALALERRMRGQRAAAAPAGGFELSLSDSSEEAEIEQVDVLDETHEIIDTGASDATYIFGISAASPIGTLVLPLVKGGARRRAAAAAYSHQQVIDLAVAIATAAAAAAAAASAASAVGSGGPLALVICAHACPPAREPSQDILEYFVSRGLLSELLPFCAGLHRETLAGEPLATSLIAFIAAGATDPALPPPQPHNAAAWTLWTRTVAAAAAPPIPGAPRLGVPWVSAAALPHLLAVLGTPVVADDLTPVAVVPSEMPAAAGPDAAALQLTLGATVPAIKYNIGDLAAQVVKQGATARSRTAASLAHACEGFAESPPVIPGSLGVIVDGATFPAPLVQMGLALPPTPRSPPRTVSLQGFIAAAAVCLPWLPPATAVSVFTSSLLQTRTRWPGTQPTVPIAQLVQTAMKHLDALAADGIVINYSRVLTLHVTGAEWTTMETDTATCDVANDIAKLLSSEGDIGAAVELLVTRLLCGFSAPTPQTTEILRAAGISYRSPVTIRPETPFAQLAPGQMTSFMPSGHAPVDVDTAVRLAWLLSSARAAAASVLAPAASGVLLRSLVSVLVAEAVRAARVVGAAQGADDIVAAGSVLLGVVTRGLDAELVAAEAVYCKWQLCRDEIMRAAQQRLEFLR